jgi:hypothetical protein
MVLNKRRDVENGVRGERYRSGETDVQGRISRCGDELARTGRSMRRRIRC